jgi:hypothetical protein
MTEFRARDFCGSNALWDYGVVNASLRSHIIHHDQSGFSRPNHKGGKGEKINNTHNIINNEMTEFNHGGCVHGSNALRVYMVINASLRSHIIYHDR